MSENEVEAVPSPGRSGLYVWIFAVQFFIMQIVVARGWTTPFSLSANFISDLGNTACGGYPAGSSNYVCSPWHAWMNTSFIVLGLTIMIGTVLNRRYFGSSALPRTALLLLAISGIGVLLVGLYPENTSISAHTTGAGLNFVGGNLGIALLGVALARAHRRPGLAIYSMISGLTGLAGTILLVQGFYMGLGIGGMERIAAYPIPLWLIVAGLALS
ncbi:MAG: DUF998 domain-containing protein [Gemmatimonadota bacterium]